tara:strand:- start:2703 stop:3650 length:948 start_codon:yes stop_codon:yes gene_type:complete
MELWLDAEMYGRPTQDPDGVRVWDGSSPDVAMVEITDARGQKEAISLIGSVPWILIRCEDWKMIPLENLVASSRGSGTKLAIAVSKRVELQGVAFALQHGVDAVALPPENKFPDIWSAARSIVRDNGDRNSGVGLPSLSHARITSVTEGGIGERACVDLTERLLEGEGIVAGSTSSCLSLIHGETIPSQYVPTRPFRINAGAIHSYVIMGDGTTKYISELESGDRVSVFSVDGSIREATIGRLKIERRPLLKISFESGEFTGNVMVQQAETVRLISSDSKPISATDISQDDEIIVVIDNSMRHIGSAVSGEVREL